MESAPVYALENELTGGGGMSQDSVLDEIAALRSRCHWDDRRADPRMRCKGIAEVTVLSLGKRLPGKLIDLSISGCCIATEGPMPPIESPVVEVQVAIDGTTLRVAGVVRNVLKDRRLGIEFVDVTQRKAQQIGELVAELIERGRESQQECVAAPENK